MYHINIFDTEIATKVIKKIQSNNFLHHLGFNFTNVESGWVQGFLNLKPEHLQQNGFAHGGIISTLCDSVAGFAAYTVTAGSAQVVTAELKVSYYYPGVGNCLWAKGWVEKAGKKLHFCESHIFIVNEITQQSKIIAKATATMAVVD